MSQMRTLPSASLRPADLRGLKVLVVDDHSVTARLIGDVLRAAGVGQVETASDGLRAREVLRKWNPDIIFTDWNMPHMDGLELTRQQAYLHAVIPSSQRATGARTPSIG